jgi:hypothetical protein
MLKCRDKKLFILDTASGKIVAKNILTEPKVGA